MAIDDHFRRQVELLIRTLPHVAAEECFALKGGTAINLFVRDLPRLSVDIDLAYLPLTDRARALSEIDAALKRIAERIRKADSTVTVIASAPGSQKEINKLVVRTRRAVQTKIEVTPVLRGCVYDPRSMTVSARTELKFGFAEMNLLSFEDLYAGKITAALDRQHPRDLFDIHLLYENEGITDGLRAAFIIYLISHNHPPQKLLSAPCRDIRHDYEQSFQGMADTDPGLPTLASAHVRLIEDLVMNMPEAHRKFLLSFYDRRPDWDLLGLPNARELPAVRWREQNLDKAGAETRAAIVEALEKLFA